MTLENGSIIECVPSKQATVARAQQEGYRPEAVAALQLMGINISI